MPVLFEDRVLGVIELASFRPFSDVNRDFLEQITETIGVVINTIRANMRTEELLEQSQGLTQELQKQSEELRNTNDELEEKARQLSEQNRDIEIKNDEIELARRGLEDKAAQLALSSKYKSEFLANMSHELRTPLNSMLILVPVAGRERGRACSPSGRSSSPRRSTGAGNDLLSLINDILDLSKVEAGRMEVDMAPVALSDIYEDAERAFRQVAEQKELEFTVEIDPELPPSIVPTSSGCGQILKNLLSNAFKFTNRGRGACCDRAAPATRASRSDTLRDGRGRDLVLGHRHRRRDPRRQAVGDLRGLPAGRRARPRASTAAPAWACSISREIAWLLGGEIHVESMPRGEGSSSRCSRR